MAGGECRPVSIKVKSPSGSIHIALQRWRTALAALLLLQLFSLLASAQNSVAWTTNYYSVTGATLPEIRQSIRQSRPWKERFDADGWTDWHVAWRFAVTSSQSGCRCSSFTTQTTIRITMPRWLAPTNAPDSVAQAWQKYAAALGQHEAGHAHLALAAAADLQKRIKEIGEGTDCESLKQRINALGEQIVEQHRKRDREYDERTRHGISQGAFLPGRMGPN
jgi:predicted secreted Zn-dependent protease